MPVLHPQTASDRFLPHSVSLHYCLNTLRFDIILFELLRASSNKPQISKRVISSVRSFHASQMLISRGYQSQPPVRRRAGPALVWTISESARTYGATIMPTLCNFSMRVTLVTAVLYSSGKNAECLSVRPFKAHW